VAWVEPGRAAGEQSIERRYADVALHLGVRRPAIGRLDGRGFSVNICEVGRTCCRLRLGGDEDLGHTGSVRDGDADCRSRGHFDTGSRPTLFTPDESEHALCWHDLGERAHKARLALHSMSLKLTGLADVAAEPAAELTPWRSVTRLPPQTSDCLSG
jgi:hypothetical protein